MAALTRAWLAGAPRPDLPYPAPIVAADPAARGLDARAVLSMWRMADPVGFTRLRDDPTTVDTQVAGAIPTDLAWLAGEHDRARAGYLAELATGPENPSGWAGLGLVLAAREPGPAADALRDRPELVQAVYRAVRGSGAAPPDPLGLAAWLGAG